MQSRVRMNGQRDVFRVTAHFDHGADFATLAATVERRQSPADRGERILYNAKSVWSYRLLAVRKRYFDEAAHGKVAVS